MPLRMISLVICSMGFTILPAAKRAAPAPAAKIAARISKTVLADLAEPVLNLPLASSLIRAYSASICFSG